MPTLQISQGIDQSCFDSVTPGRVQSGLDAVLFALATTAPAKNASFDVPALTCSRLRNSLQTALRE
jgi:hypothetical protein